MAIKNLKYMVIRILENEGGERGTECRDGKELWQEVQQQHMSSHWCQRGLEGQNKKRDEIRNRQSKAGRSNWSIER